MGRRIVGEEFHATGGPSGPSVDGYFDRIIKYIPSDVVGAWVAVAGIIGQPTVNGPPRYTTLWISFAFGVVFTFLWTAKQTMGGGLPFARTQVLLSTVAFVVWVFALGGPFRSFGWYDDSFGSLALIGFTLLTGLVVPKEASTTR